ncbi:MAG: hypothetical protein IJ514_04185 [Clostridia bacterium]|nr:hypothetical protein [Clostridia bacterium]
MATTVKDRGVTLRRIYAWVLSVWTALVGVLFIVQVWRIFALGNRSFTTANIAQYFSQIAVFVWLWVALAVGGAVLWRVYPKQAERPLAVIEPKYTLMKLKRRLPQTEGMSTVRKQGISRIVVWSACAIACIACAVVALVYMLGEYTPRATVGFFAAHEEAERFVRALPWALAALCVWTAAAYFEEYSYKKEIKLVKEQLAENAKRGIKGTASAQAPTLWDKICVKLPFLRSKWFLRGVRIFVAVLGIGLVLYDLIFLEGGGMADMLEKAIHICTQCIGLG